MNFVFLTSHIINLAHVTSARFSSGGNDVLPEVVINFGLDNQLFIEGDDALTAWELLCIYCKDFTPIVQALQKGKDV